MKKNKHQKDKKSNRSGMVYSTNPDFEYEEEVGEELETLAPSEHCIPPTNYTSRFPGKRSCNLLHGWSAITSRTLLSHFSGLTSLSLQLAKKV